MALYIQRNCLIPFFSLKCHPEQYSNLWATFRGSLQIHRFAFVRPSSPLSSLSELMAVIIFHLNCELD